MTTKQVETSITINTTARSIFICTTMNSYVQYFQKYIPFAFTIEGSRHPLPHPSPLSYLFHFLSFFFFFSLCEEVAPFPPYPAFILFLSLYETVTPFPPYLPTRRYRQPGIKDTKSLSGLQDYYFIVNFNIRPNS